MYHGCQELCATIMYSAQFIVARWWKFVTKFNQTDAFFQLTGLYKVGYRVKIKLMSGDGTGRAVMLH